MTKPSEKLVEFPQASARDVLTMCCAPGRSECWPRRSRRRLTSIWMLGRPPWTPPGNGVWSATAACPSGRYRPQSGRPGAATAGPGPPARSFSHRWGVSARSSHEPQPPRTWSLRETRGGSVRFKRHELAANCSGGENRWRYNRAERRACANTARRPSARQPRSTVDGLPHFLTRRPTAPQPGGKKMKRQRNDGRRCRCPRRQRASRRESRA